MKLCIFCSRYLDLAGLGKHTVLAKVSSSLNEDDVDQVYVTSYRLGEEAANLYLLHGHETLRMILCRRLFRIIDMNRWIPTCLARIPLLFCQKEIMELLLGCDPDVVLIPDIRWGNQLVSVLKQHFRHWTYILGAGQPLDVSQQWRKYDPSARVSIVLPTYNGSKYIRRSIDSCLRQTHANIELLVVDDASHEDIQGIVNEYADSRIQYFRHTKNLGVAEALNTGFRNSTGAYLTWTSDDNYYEVNAIEEMARFLQTYPEIDFVYAENYIIDERGADRGQRIQRSKPPESLKVNNFIGACFLYTRKVYHTIGDYNPGTFLAEDYDYWVRVSKQFRMQRLFRPLYYYRFHKDSLTSKHKPDEVLEKVSLVKQLNKIPSI